MQDVEWIAGSIAWLTMQHYHLTKTRETNLPCECISNKWAHFKARKATEGWEMVKKWQNDTSHLKCLSRSGRPAALVDPKSVCVCVFVSVLSVLPLVHWSIFFTPWGKKMRQMFYWSGFHSCCSLCFWRALSFAWLTLILFAPLCLRSHFSVTVCLYGGEPGKQSNTRFSSEAFVLVWIEVYGNSAAGWRSWSISVHEVILWFDKRSPRVWRWQNMPL